MRASGVALAWWLCGVTLALAGCVSQGEVASTEARPAARAGQAAQPLPAAGPLLTGASIAAMADQYARPRLGPTPGAGASAWVAPGPPPAFVVSTPLPPAAPPAPPPAAVANRQPSTPAPAAPAAAAAPAAPAVEAANVDVANGRALFTQYSCGSCHVLADAGGSGGIGPSLDANPRLTREFTIGAISEGRGGMPAFRDVMSAEEIATLADYIVQVSRK